MHFDLVDRVLSLTPDRIVTLKQVTAAEEYLQDHFPTFPVLPGVLMLEALVQAARRLAESRPEFDASAPPLVLGRARALKYGRFVKPGAALRCEVTLAKPPERGSWEFKAEAVVLEPGASGEPPVAVSGRLTLRPARVPAARRLVSEHLPR
jgi:3-hydroxyacyl-[acyl-carrier-protein] dehydratase